MTSKEAHEYCNAILQTMLRAIEAGRGHLIEISWDVDTIDISTMQDDFRQYIGTKVVTIVLPEPPEKNATYALSPENFINTVVVGLQFGESKE